MLLRKRLFAWMYHNLLSGQGEADLSDPMTRNVRAPLIARARGDVLEIGAGDGGNLPLYPPGIRLSLLEPNPFLFRYLRARCQEYPFVCEALVAGYGERLPFPDESFDTIITTHVLCSVADQAGVLAEIRRVLRSGGQFLFLEHVAAHPGTALYRRQRLVNPIWKAVGDGCHLTRNTDAAIHAAGFTAIDLTRFEHEGFPAIVSPHIYGVATA